MRFLLPFFIVFSNSLFAQLCLNGTIKDADSKEVLPFVNIGLRNKNIGTISNKKGEFSICIDEHYLNDTLTLSIMGYHEVKIPVFSLDSSSKTFLLESMPSQLNEVVISAKKMSEKKLGLSRDPILHFLDASTNQKDIFEIGQLIKLGKNTAKIKSVNLLIGAARPDSGTFRINFYHYDGRRPADRIIEKKVLQLHSIKEGWLRFDLLNDEIFLKGDVIVAIEFIPTDKTSAPIKYEIKPGGRAKSFVRTSSLGTWQIPPHNYRMYITALGMDEPVQNDEIEKETTPAFRLFSRIIKDSFSIFIKLPANYQKVRNCKTVYLLDANLYFNYIADSLEKIANNPTMIIGIGYNNFIQMDSLRNRDYTYPKALLTDSFYTSGGGDKFYEFIRKELVPYIDSQYHIENTERTIMGHSLGGYFTLYALYKDITEGNSPFNRYIAASPSIEYHNNYLVNQFSEIRTDTINHQRLVYITWGGMEDDDGSKRIYTAIMNSVINLLTYKQFKLQILSTFFPFSGHMETALPTFYNGISAER